MKPRLLGVTAVLALLAPAYHAHPTRPIDRLPPLMLWAWERPVDLRGLPAGAGVAFLAQTITASPDAIVVSPRRQPLRVDPGTRLIAVTRIEAPGDAPSAPEPLDEMARAIGKTAALPQVDGVQIDFDARVSQRAMYRQLLHAIRRSLPPETPLSMTALASWCLDDRWLDDLPIDEVVPMLFRMGPSQEPLRASLAWRTLAPACHRRGPGRGRDDFLRPRVRTVVYGIPDRRNRRAAAPRRVRKGERRGRAPALRAALPRPGVPAVHRSASPAEPHRSL